MTPPVVSSVMPVPPAQPGAQGPVPTGLGVTGFEALLAALTPGLADGSTPGSEDPIAQPGDDEPAANNLPDPGLMGGFVLTSLFVPPPPVAVPQGQAISVPVEALAPGPAAKAPTLPGSGPDLVRTSEADADAEVTTEDGLVDLATPDLLAGSAPSPADRPEPRTMASRHAAAPPEAHAVPTATSPQAAAPVQPSDTPPPPAATPAQGQAAGDSTDVAVASGAETKDKDATAPSAEAPKLATDASSDPAPLRPAARPQQGQDNPGSGSDGERRQDTGNKAQATSQASDASTPATRNDFAAQLQPVASAHGTVADQVKAAPHTVAHMAEQIIRKVDGQTTRFDIQLDPLGLGQVDVRIEIGADGQLKAAMSFETQSAANELQARSGELKRALEDAGFNLGGGLSFEVSRNPNGSGRDLAQQQQQQQAHQDNRSGGGRAFQAAMDRADTPDEPVRAGEIYLQRRTLSGIDVRI